MTVTIIRGDQVLELTEEEAQIFPPSLDQLRQRSRIPFSRLLRGLFKSNSVTGQQLLAWARTGAIPAVIEAEIDALPTTTDEEIEFKIQVDRELRYGTAFNRLDPSIALLQSAFGFTDAQVDAFFGIS